MQARSFARGVALRVAPHEQSVLGDIGRRRAAIRTDPETRGPNRTLKVSSSCLEPFAAPVGSVERGFLAVAEKVCEGC
jgi:hypothetical protein